MEVGTKLEKLRRRAGSLMREMARAPELVPVDEIDPKAVSRAIAFVLKPDSTYRVPEEAKFKMFSVVDVMDALGHHDVFDHPKLIDQFRRGRERTRLIIDQYIKIGVLEDTVLDSPDADGETIHYALRRDEAGSIENSEAKLRQIAEGKITLEAA